MKGNGGKGFMFFVASPSFEKGVSHSYGLQSCTSLAGERSRREANIQTRKNRKFFTSQSVVQEKV